MAEPRWDLVKRILDEALRLPPAEREDYVRRVAAHDAIVRDEVLSLIAQDTDNGFLEAPTFGASLEGSELPLDGAKFDGLEIVRPLGRGGMGVVYLAKDLELHCEVAVKMLPSYASFDAAVVDRFRREARRVASLKHPHIVAIHRLSEHQGCPYFVMDYIPGHDLASEIEAQVGGELGSPSRQPLLPRRDAQAYDRCVAELVALTADALEEAHGAGIVHRDVKPSNILLDRKGQPYLADFGIARDERFGAPTTHVGPIGTPEYMSPEQARAIKSQVDHRTDIYSLGVVLYELLTLQRPFQGITRDVVLSQVLGVEPRRPSRLRTDVSKTLETICLKAMSKLAVDRYPTAKALGEDLRRFLRGERVDPGATAPIARTRRYLQRHRTRIVVASVVLILGAMSGALLLKAAPPGRDRTSLRVVAGDRVPEGQQPEISLLTLDLISGEPVSLRKLGQAPLEVDSLQPGSYRIVAKFGGGRITELARSIGYGPGTTVPVPWPKPAEEAQAGMILVRGASVRPDFSKWPHPPLDAPVLVRDFLMDATEVSNGAYAAFCLATGRETPRFWQQALPSERGPVFDSLPVTDISLEDAEAFAEWSGKRLPTLLEWILAAQGEELASTPWPSEKSPGEVQANFFVFDPPSDPTARERFLNYLENVLPVDSSPEARTQSGIHHLYGNVSEMTGTVGYQPGPAGTTFDPGTRVILGGNFSLPKQIFPVIGSKGRGSARGSIRLGFRCARSLSE